jgi:aryl-alcohol dehydrogenase-like predicted oxidoreductase
MEAGITLAQQTVTSVIIGARKRSELDDNLKSIDLQLSAEELPALRQVRRRATPGQRRFAS